MGACMSEPEQKNTRDVKPGVISETTKAVDQRPAHEPAKPMKKFDLAESGFAENEREFLEKVKQNSTMLSKADLPLSWTELTVRKFDVDTFLQLCRVIKEQEGNDGHSDAAGAWECQFRARWGDATSTDKQVAAYCGGWKVAYASQLIRSPTMVAST